MSQLKVSKQFVKDFEAVCKHYDCSPDEVELMKQASRNDLENAKVCFSSLAGEINKFNTYY